MNDEQRKAAYRESVEMTWEPVEEENVPWPVRIDEMLAAMSRAAHMAADSNADLLPSYQRNIELIQTIRSELLAALSPEKPGERK